MYDVDTPKNLGQVWACPRPLEITMKIGNSAEHAAAPVGTDKPAAAQAGQAGKAQANGAAATGAAKKPEASAQIELSSTATSLRAGGSNEGSFDVEKVGRITQAISEGKFTVNADAIADKLIANAQGNARSNVARTEPAAAQRRF